MKKFVMFLVLVMLAGLTAGVAAENSLPQKFSVSASAGILFPSDSGFKSIYGKSLFMPELKATYSFMPDWYVWASFGLTSAKGTTPELGLEAKSNQSFFALGAGYRAKISEKFSLLGELGLMQSHFKETALEQTTSGNKMGFRLGVGLQYNICHGFFGLLALDYFSAKDTIEDVTFKSGGFKSALGVGIRF